MLWFIFILILIPAIEVGIFIWTGAHIGIIPVVLLIILTGIAGVALFRQQGAEVWRRAQFAMYNNEPPANEIMDGICIIIGGIFLIAPGFFTDFLGFLFVLPWTRPPFRRLIGFIMMKFIAKGNFIIRRR